MNFIIGAFKNPVLLSALAVAAILVGVSLNYYINKNVDEPEYEVIVETVNQTHDVAETSIQLDAEAAEGETSHPENQDDEAKINEGEKNENN